MPVNTKLPEPAAINGILINHKMAIKRLVQAGVVPTTYESILFELTVDAKNPNFKAISSLIK
jgi:hypothetical protein